MWNGEYVQIHPKGALASLPQAVDGLRKGHLVEIPGHLVIPINLGQDPVSLLPDSAIKRKLNARVQKRLSPSSFPTTRSILTPMSSAS